MMNNELIPTPMMSFGESVKTCFQKYVTFKGRARRSEYWWFWLLNLIVSIVTLVLDYKLDMINIEFGIGALSGLYTLIVFLPKSCGIRTPPSRHRTQRLVLPPHLHPHLRRAVLALLLCQRLCSRGEPIRQEPEVRTGDILTSNDRFGLQPKTVESTLRRVVAPPPENKSKDIAMNKKDLFVYLRGLLTFVIFASAITWFYFHTDQLLSPRMSYIVHLSLSIGITILLTISFLTLCWYLLVTVFNKGRKLTMKTRLLVASLCLVGILLLQDTFGIPLGLPERISRIINTIFGNGV